MEDKKKDNKRDSRGRRGRGRRREQQPREFDQKILDLARVTRVTAGGKRMRFRVCLIIGDRKGRVGYGIAKGADVQIAVEKAFRQAKKNLIEIPLVNETFTHAVTVKEGSARIILKPAPKGTGLKSGGAIRLVLEMAGVPNAVSKILGTNSKINNTKAAFVGLKMLGASPSAPRMKETKRPAKRRPERKRSRAGAPKAL